MLRRAVLAAIPAALCARGAQAAFAPGDAVQLRVRAGGDDLDEAVFEAVFPPFAEVMPLKRTPPFSHTLDVTFASAGRDWLTRQSRATARKTVDDHWYLGDRKHIEPESLGNGLPRWQTSRMHVVLRRINGDPLWAADYDYDGGMEFSGWTVKTPAQAARLIARRLAARLKAKPELLPS